MWRCEQKVLSSLSGTGRSRKDQKGKKSKLNAEQRQQIENYLEAVQHLAFMEEERAYCQGYVDCIQLLGGLGILNSNPEIEMMVSKMKK